MKKILLISFALFQAVFVFAQQKQIDSLTDIIIHKKGKEHILNLIKIADVYLANSPDKSIHYLELALEEAKESHDNENALIANEKIGNAYFLKGNFEKAFKYYNVILDEIPDISNVRYNIDLFTRKGKIYANLGEFDKSLVCYQNSLKSGEYIHDTTAIAWAYSNIGYIYFLLQEYPIAIDFFNKSLNYFITLDDSEGIADSYNKMGIIYGVTYNNDSALFCFYKSLDIKLKINSSDKIPVAFDNIGEVYLQKNMPDSALYYLNSSYKILSEQNSIYDLSYVLNYLAKSYLLKKDYKKALDCLNKSKIIALNSKYWYISAIYSTYTDYYVQTGDYKNAFKYLKLHYGVKDSIFNEKKKHKISELQVKYGTNEKVKQIDSLSKEKELIQLNLRKKNTIIILITFAIVIITFFAFAIYAALKLKNKANRLLNIKNIEIERQKEEIIVKNDVLEKQKEEITAQKESLEDTNAELSKINVYLEKLSNRNLHIDLAIIISAAEGKIESVNMGFFKIFGYASSEIADYYTSIYDWYHLDDAEQVLQAIKAKETVNFETTHKSKADHTIFVQTTLMPLTDQSGDVIKIIAIETEITKF